MLGVVGRALLAVVCPTAVEGLQLLEKNCWPNWDVHYALCCHEDFPADPRCFTDGRTFELCCRCSSKSSSCAAGRNCSDGSADGAGDADPASGSSEGSTLGFQLSRRFFSPLLCDGPSVRARREDFLVDAADGSHRLLRVYIYPLHRRFNADLINRLQLGGWILGTECDYGLTLCTEEQWNGLFSVYRQFATEVLVLMKFLAAPPGVLTENPEEADLFVVPYFAKTDCAESGTAGREPCWGKCKCATAVKYLFEDLPHYSWETRGRHLFLATGDIKDLPVEIQAQPLLISLGASYCGGHFVVPSPALDAVLQPHSGFEARDAMGAAPDRHIFLFWFGSNDKQWRQIVIEQLHAYRRSSGARAVVVHEIGSDYEARDVWQTDARSPKLVLEEMYRSVFCPVIQGDVPHQKRLFDSILTGCLPVVVAFPSHVAGQVSWWLPGGPPVDRMLPFPDDIDYRSFVVEVPQAEVERGGFVQALQRLSELEIEQRREAMRRARPFVRFDFGGAGADAFTLLVRSMWRFLDRGGSRSAAAARQRSGFATTSGEEPAELFDCGMPPTLGGNQMYGHMACCPIRASG